MVFGDGRTLMYGFGEDPATPVPLPPVRRLWVGGVPPHGAVLPLLGGFDPSYVPAYCEDVDLQFSLRARGLRTVYQPRSRVGHVRFGSAASAPARRRMSVRNTRILRSGGPKPWRPGRRSSSEPPCHRLVAVRDADASDRVLVLGDRPPERLLHALARRNRTGRVTFLTTGIERVPTDDLDRLADEGVEVEVRSASRSRGGANGCSTTPRWSRRGRSPGPEDPAQGDAAPGLVDRRQGSQRRPGGADSRRPPGRGARRAPARHPIDCRAVTPGSPAFPHARADAASISAGLGPGPCCGLHGLPPPGTTPTTGAGTTVTGTTPAEVARGPFARMACNLPAKWLLRILRGYYPGRAGEIQILPKQPNYFGAWTHSGPWEYLQQVPMFLYGPGHVPAVGEVGRPVTMADLAPTLALYLGQDFRHARRRSAPRGRRPRRRASG